jgi:hypothetical protein
VIALIHARDPDFVKEASKRGVFAYITDADAKDWQSSIDIVLRRFTEYHDLEGAFGRRAVTERAKGILMERHSIDEPAAFEMLREHARSTNRKLVDVASAVVDGHRLLPKRPNPPDPTHGAGGNVKDLDAAWWRDAGLLGPGLVHGEQGRRPRKAQEAERDNCSGPG